MVIKTGFLTEKQLVKIRTDLHKNILPEAYILYDLIDMVESQIIYENKILILSSPIKIFGDIHGQFSDIKDHIDEESQYLFLGDFVDRGANSVELLIFLFVMKILHRKIFFLRGNHEFSDLNNLYGFKDECVKKYSSAVWIRIGQLFNYFSVCAIIDDVIFAVHGGIGPEHLTIESLEDVDCSSRSSLYWSDPSESVDFFEKSTRGCGYFFGRNAFFSFMQKFNFRLMIRSHQLCMTGFSSCFNGKCITIWSAPNYCYMKENNAAYIIIKKTGEKIKYEVIYFSAVKNQKLITAVRNNDFF